QPVHARDRRAQPHMPGIRVKMQRGRRGLKRLQRTRTRPERILVRAQLQNLRMSREAALTALIEGDVENARLRADGRMRVGHTWIRMRLRAVSSPRPARIPLLSHLATTSAALA